MLFRHAICKKSPPRVMLAVVLALLIGFAPVAQAQPAPSQAMPEAPDAKQVRAAMEGALRWLADQQIKEGPDAGSWDSPQYPTATTSIAGLAFLANGHKPGEGEYGQVLERAMRYIQPAMASDGYLGGQGNSMYVHALCTLFGLAYLGASDNIEHDRELAVWCSRAVQLIVEAQGVSKPRPDRGGWRYSPYMAESDLSVTSWQMLALHSARQCGYQIDPAVIAQGMRYVNSGFITTDDGEAGFCYRPGISRAPEPPVSGTALFLKAVFEDQPDEKVTATLQYLDENPPSWGGPQYKGFFYFGSIYMAKGMFQTGGERWQRFDAMIKRILLDHQQGDGSWPFTPNNAAQVRLAGPAYPTAMAVLILSLDKQYLPMYQRQRGFYR